MCMILKWLTKVAVFIGQYQVDLILDVLFLSFDKRDRREGSSFGWLGQVGSHAGSIKIEDKDEEALR